jgi:hypothetical protein
LIVHLSATLEQRRRAAIVGWSLHHAAEPIRPVRLSG